MSRESENVRSTQHGAKAATAHEIDFEAEHRPDVARRASLAGLRREIQKKAAAAATANEAVHDAAARGVAAPTTALPHAEQIQASFGAKHDVSRIQAHVGGDAAAAMGATAFASGSHVVFDRPPDLHTAAHEAAHVVQQAQGVNLYGGVGQAGDAYERHADAVADRVVAGQSAADLLGAPIASASSLGTVQRKEAPNVSDATVEERRDQHVRADDAGPKAINAALRFAAKELHMQAEQIETVIHAPPGEAGIDRQLRTIEQVFAGGRDTVHRLSIELGLAHHGRLAEGDDLKVEVVAFERAYTHFSGAVVQAERYARTDPQEHLNVDTKLMQGEVTRMFGDRRWEIPVATQDVAKLRETGHATTDPRTESADHLLAQALAANAEATIQTAHLVRMQMTRDPDEALDRNSGRLTAFVLELASLLERADKKTVKLHKAAISKALHEVENLEKESAGKPALVQHLGPGTMFSEAVRKSRAQVGR